MNTSKTTKTTKAVAQDALPDSPVSRRDWVVMWTTAGVCVALVAWVSVISPLLSWARGAAVSAKIAIPDDVSAPALDAAGLTYDGATFQVLIQDPSAIQRLLVAAPGLLYGVLSLVGGLLAVRIVRSVQRGTEFDRTTVARLRAFAIYVLVTGVGGAVVGGLLATPLAISLVGTARGMFAIPIWPVLVASFLLVMAEAFNRGRLLAEDAEGLV